MKDICDLFLDFYTNISLQHTHPESKYSRAAEDAGALLFSLEVRSEVLRRQESLRTTQPKHQHQSSSASPLYRSLVCSSLCVLTFTSRPEASVESFHLEMHSYTILQLQRGKQRVIIYSRRQPENLSKCVSLHRCQCRKAAVQSREGNHPDRAHRRL